MFMLATKTITFCVRMVVKYPLLNGRQWFFMNFSGRYQFSQSFFAEAGLNYTRLDVEGTQEQEFVLTGIIGEAAEEAESDQMTAHINIGFRL